MTRHLGLLLFFPIVVAAAEEGSPPLELSSGQFRGCLDAQGQYNEIMSRQLETLQALINEAKEIRERHQQHWDKVSPHLLGTDFVNVYSAMRLGNGTVPESMVKTIVDSYSAALSLLEWKNAEQEDMVGIHAEMVAAFQAQVQAGSDKWEACLPILKFVARGLDGQPGNLSAEPKDSR
ncbi:MAG: hypothetical protein OXJ37_14260 [Bryobacterales bacterium]|nr:hypothetical protein [Bryobacterales bacterium]